jgi:hypothetical protein
VPFQYSVVVPTNLIGKQEMRLALLHELQHHRQGDTAWVHGFLFLKLICGFNPFVHLWSRLVTEVQEFACDEALVDHKGVSSSAYARCLIQVAETAVGMRESLVCATGLSFMTDRQTLKRRVEKMMTNRSIGHRKWLGMGAAVCAMVSFCGMAWASQNWIQDRRVSLNDAQDLAGKVRTSSGIPIVVNDLVLKELNRYIGTPEGREFMKNSLARMDNFKSLVSQKTQEYGVPDDLMAIPIIESGYENRPQPSNQSWGAGLWMFIKSTARNYGLKVTDEQDERLNVDLETDAAMRLLVANKMQFKSWELSVLAYNIGENQVLEGIKKTGSRDVWDLIRAGYENDKAYYPRLIAAILIMRNPAALD